MEELIDDAVEDDAAVEGQAEVLADADDGVEVDSAVDAVEEAEAVDVHRLVAEAEQRGYLRGRNEAASESMNRTALLENVRLTQARAMEAPDPTSLFLTRLRPDVWD